MKNTSAYIYSKDDIFDTTKRYLAENSEEVAEVILYFVSELTGMSVDAIMEAMSSD